MSQPCEPAEPTSREAYRDRFERRAKLHGALGCGVRSRVAGTVRVTGKPRDGTETENGAVSLGWSGWGWTGTGSATGITTGLDVTGLGGSGWLQQKTRLEQLEERDRHLRMVWNMERGGKASAVSPSADPTFSCTV